MNITQERKAEYIFVVHEFGLPPNVIAAYRRTGFITPRKYAKCPYCSQRLFDMNPDTKVELYRFPERADELRTQTMHKCLNCKRSVGVNYIY